MTLSPDALGDATVLVTGASGFIGSATVRRLLAAGARVIASDFRAPESGGGDSGGLEFITGEFTSSTDLLAVALEGTGRKWRGIVHLAGMSHAGDCERDRAAAFATNVGLTAAVLEFARQQRVSRLVLPSTGLVYGDHLGELARESFPPAPASYYAATKLTAEWLARSHAGAGLGVVVARLANVYGRGANRDSVTAEVVRQAAAGAEVTVRDACPVRDFIYVEDVAEGLLRLLLVVDAGQVAVNLSTAKGSSVAELVEAACRVAGGNARPVLPDSGGGPTSCLVLANDRLAELTGWRPAVSLAEGLSRTLKG